MRVPVVNVNTTLIGLIWLNEVQATNLHCLLQCEHVGQFWCNIRIHFFLQKESNARLIRNIIQAFKAAVATTKGEGQHECRYSVADSSGKCLFGFLLDQIGCEEMKACLIKVLFLPFSI